MAVGSCIAQRGENEMDEFCNGSQGRFVRREDVG